MRGYPDHGYVTALPVYGSVSKLTNTDDLLTSNIIIANLTDDIFELHTINAFLTLGNVQGVKIYIYDNITDASYSIDGVSTLLLGQFLVINQKVFLYPNQHASVEYYVPSGAVEMNNVYAYTRHIK